MIIAELANIDTNLQLIENSEKSYYYVILTEDIGAINKYDTNDYVVRSKAGFAYLSDAEKLFEEWRVINGL